MKRIFLLILTLILTSCASKEDKVKAIIDNSYFGIYNSRKMSEIEKLKEDIFSLPIHYTIVEKYATVNKENKHEIVRYIYKTNDGVYRTFYLIDMTNKKVIEKSSDYNDFFRPILTEILGENSGDMEGNTLMELMRY
tara:strand:+ start:43 stop:453 length:411 start_codon:yes stop_codon:yes gene_type:complete